MGDDLAQHERPRGFQVGAALSFLLPQLSQHAAISLGDNRLGESGAGGQIFFPLLNDLNEWFRSIVTYSHFPELSVLASPPAHASLRLASSSQTLSTPSHPRSTRYYSPREHPPALRLLTQQYDDLNPRLHCALPATPRQSGACLCPYH